MHADLYRFLGLKSGGGSNQTPLDIADKNRDDRDLNTENTINNAMRSPVDQSARKNTRRNLLRLRMIASTKILDDDDSFATAISSHFIGCSLSRGPEGLPPHNHKAPHYVSFAKAQTQMIISRKYTHVG